MSNAQLKPYQAILKAAKKYEDADELDLMEVAIYLKKGDWVNAKKVALGLDALLRDECFEPRTNEVSDDENEQFIYRTTSSSLLAEIVNDFIDPRELAWRELRNRGLDATGKWVGFGEGKCKKPF